MADHQPRDAEFRAVREALSTLPDEWTVLHDLHWPGRALDRIDHVVAGPAGVFVITTRSWSGAISISEEVLRIEGRSQPVTVEQTLAATRALSAVVPALPYRAFTPVLCFLGEDGIDGAAHGMMIRRLDSLLESLLTLPKTLSVEWLEFLRFELDLVTRPAEEPSFAVAPVPLPVAPIGREDPLLPGWATPPMPAARPRRRERLRGLRRFTPRRRGPLVANRLLRRAMTRLGVALLFWLAGCALVQQVIPLAAVEDPAGAATIAGCVLTLPALLLAWKLVK